MTLDPMPQIKLSKEHLERIGVTPEHTQEIFDAVGGGENFDAAFDRVLVDVPMEAADMAKAREFIGGCMPDPPDAGDYL